jgi:hypothetical protein
VKTKQKDCRDQSGLLLLLAFLNLKHFSNEAVFTSRMGFGGRTSPNSSIRRQPGWQLVDSVADFCLRIDDYGSRQTFIGYY